MLNAGYKRGATIPRCVGDAKSMRIQRFRVFAPVALAGLAGNMPSTITTRSITIHMRRRAPGETVEPFEEQDAERDAEPIRDALAAWTATPAAGNAVRIRPDLPDGVVDRAAEVWRPLIAVADAAAGRWPERARDACRHFVLDRGPEAVSLGVRLLADLRAVYHRLGVDRLPRSTRRASWSRSKRHGPTSTASRSTPAGSPASWTATTPAPARSASPARSPRATRPPAQPASPTPGPATSRSTRLRRLPRLRSSSAR